MIKRMTMIVGVCTALAGCGSDADVADDAKGMGGAAGVGTGSGGSAQGGSFNTAGNHQVTGGSDAGANAGDGGPFSLPDLDTKCGDGPTGRDLLAFIHLPYAGTFTPPNKRPAMFPWNGSTVPSALTVGVEYNSGAILCTIDDYVCPGGGVPCRVQFPPKISVDLEVTFKTADGLLNESLTATAQYSSNISSMNLRADLPATKIAGTYPIVTGSRDQVKLVFGGLFEGAKYSGAISEVGQGTSIPGGSWIETAVGAGADASTDH